MALTSRPLHHLLRKRSPSPSLRDREEYTPHCCCQFTTPARENPANPHP